MPPQAPKAAKRKAKSASLQSAIEAVVAGTFNLTAVLTMHEHWLKDAEEVRPITDPLNAWMDRLPAKQLKAFEEKICPILLGVGLATVLVPDIVLEVKIRESIRRASRAEAGTDGSHIAPQAHPYRGPDLPGPGGNGQYGGGRESKDERDASRPPQIPGYPV